MTLYDISLALPDVFLSWFGQDSGWHYQPKLGVQLLWPWNKPQIITVTFGAN